MSNDALMATYSRLPITFERGAGAWLWDTNGNKYLDAFSGVAVCNLGHAHPAVSKAICEQAGQLIHTSNWYAINHQQQLANQLARLTGLEKAFFCNSGAEANEAAIKIARLLGHSKGIQQPTIIVTEHSFHGRTLATLSATGSRRVQAGFEPLVSGFLRVPYNDLEALSTIARSSPEVIAILVEPIIGEGGIQVPGDEYLSGIRAICDQHGWLMMLDEIQTGMCRTGRWFAYQHYNILPDVLTLAKGLGNGMPIGACLASGAAANIFQPGNHGSTFGGNPLACRAALATIHALEQDGLANRAGEIGQRMMEKFSRMLGRLKQVVDIRGKGLMIGIELDRPCMELITRALDQNLLINVTADKVVRILPPLVINDAEADQIVTQVCGLIKDFGSNVANA